MNDSDMEVFGKYVLSYEILRAALAAEKSYLQSIWSGQGSTPQESAMAKVADTLLDNELAHIDIAYTKVVSRFHSGDDAPSPQEVDKAYDLAQAVAEELRKYAITVEVLGGVSKSVEEWTSI